MNNIITPKILFAGNEDKHNRKQHYRDPLTNWPMRGLAFTNDVGAAIMDIAPALGTALWVPALMYFGADIYDKYKNDKQSYDPSARRGLKQAAFQAFASIFFPIATVHIGQKTASRIGEFLGKKKVSLQTQEAIINHHIEYMSNKKLQPSQDHVEEYKDLYKKRLNNYIDEKARLNKTKNPLKLLINLLFATNHYESPTQKRKAHIFEFANERIDELFETRAKLMAGEKPENMSEKLFKKFNIKKAAYAKTAEDMDDATQMAAKDILKQIENNKIFKIKLKKSLGGFVALALLIKPIDKFVENIIIKKIVEPGLNKIQRNQVEEMKDKFIPHEELANKTVV